MLNKLFNEDCLETMKRMGDNSVDFIMADPPYLISNKKDTFSQSSDNNLSKCRTVQGDWDLGDNEIIYDCIKEFKRILKRGGSLIIWYDWKKISYVYECLDSFNLKQIRLCEWLKCLSGSTELYIKNFNGVQQKMFMKDIARSNVYNKIQLWDGENWNYISKIEENTVDNIIYEIQLKSGEKIKATPNHKFILNNGEIKLSSQLNKKDILKTTIIPEGDNYYEYISEEAQWFIGLYLAEGSMSNKKMQIASHKKETYRIEKIDLLCKQYGGTYFVYNEPNSNSMSIVVSSSILYSIVFEYIVGDSSYNKHFTSKFWNMNNKFIKNVFHSYLDGDGSYDEKNNRYGLGFTGKNDSLQNDIRTICSKLKYRVCLNKCYEYNKKTGKSHIVWRGKLYLKEYSKRFITSEIKEIKIINKGRTRYWDIQLENEPHLFSLSSGVLTHNSNPVPLASENSYLGNSKEYFVYAAKNTSYKKEWFKATFNSKYDKGVYECSIAGKNRIHPTEKPYKLMEEIILKHTNIGDIVYIPFGGSGVDIEVCIRNERNYICSELSPEYCLGIENRISEL